MFYWVCKCGCSNLNTTKCRRCGNMYKKATSNTRTYKTRSGGNNKSYPFTIVYTQNGREMRNIVDAKKKESVVTKFLKALTRISECDIVDVLEGEHLEW